MIGVCSLYFLLMVMSGCQVQEPSGEPQRRQLPPEPQVSNQMSFLGCDTRPDEGPSMSQMTLAFEESDYFQKVWPAQVSEVALKSSSLSVAQWLHRQGVAVYHSDSPTTNSCEYFGFLPQVPNSLLQTWQQQPGANSTVPGNQLMGLFRTLFRRATNGLVSLVEPSIIVRKDTRRWTLLHEKSHYLFALGRSQQRNMPFIEDLREENRSLYRELRQKEYDYMVRQRKDLASEILEIFRQFYSVNMALFKRGPLEEFSIEAHLSTQAINEKIFAIDKTEHLPYALFYMEINSDPVLMSFRSFKNTLNNYTTNLFIHEGPEIHKQIQKLLSEIQSHRSFIESKQDRLRQHIMENDLPLREERGTLETHAHYDLKILREQLELIQNLERGTPQLSE